MTKRNFPQWLEQLQSQALTKVERQLVLLVGDACWVKALLKINDKIHSKDDFLVFSHHPDIVSTINNKHFAQQLGTENSKILFSCVETPMVETINLDAFAALSGTLVAGGVMFLWLEQSLEQAILGFAGCAVITSHDRWFLDRIATHILAFEGESQVVWFEGTWSEYEADKRKRLGEDANTPKRIKYKTLLLHSKCLVTPYTPL